jgi:hypothetical protein
MTASASNTGTPSAAKSFGGLAFAHADRAGQADHKGLSARTQNRSNASRKPPCTLGSRRTPEKCLKGRRG